MKLEENGEGYSLNCERSLTTRDTYIGDSSATRCRRVGGMVS